jgi:tetratricopeptide (TPR) repeat protein
MNCQILTGLLTGLVVSTTASLINCQPSYAENHQLSGGIPINSNLRLLASAKVDLGVEVARELVAAEPTAEDFYNQGGEKYKKGDYQGAIESWDRAIGINPN